MPDELATVVVKFRKNGDLTIDEDGTKVIVAHYDRESGHLEFETKEHSVKLYQQITARIGTVQNGTQPSGLVIRSYGVKGEARSDTANVPKRPKLGPLGDTAEAVVEWYLKYDMPQAIIRYGIYTDARGNPIRKDCRRILEKTTDIRADVEDDDLPWVKTGSRTQEKTPVFREKEMIEVKGALVARRATPLTFTPSEVVGGFQPEDDFADAAAAPEGEE